MNTLALPNSEAISELKTPGISEEMWFQLNEFVTTDQETQQIIRIKKGYITGLEYEDLNQEALIVAVESYQKCQELFRCPECNATSCNIYLFNYLSSLRKKLYELQDLKKRYGITSYTELEHDEYEYPTHCRKDWNKAINSEQNPLNELIEEEEQAEREEIKKQNTEKILLALSKMKEKERKVWELYLTGVDIKEIAARLGYNKFQGVYMALRRSLYKVKISCRQF